MLVWCVLLLFGMLQIYTDGSFKGDAAGWGYVAVFNGFPLFKGSGTLKKFQESYQIGGECLAVLMGLAESKRRGYHEVEVLFDYIGVEGWAKKWRAKTEVAKWYKENVADVSNGINIKWTKVKGHSGNKWNEFAHKLAEHGLKS